MHTYKRTRFTRLAASVFIIVESVTLAALPLFDFEEGAGAPEPSMAEAFALMGLGLGLLFSVFLAAGFFLRWFYVSHKNLSALGIKGLSQTSGWAVGYFFVPFANLIRPFEAAKEMWQGSDVAIPKSEYGYEWRSVPVSKIVGAWWITWMIASVAGNMTTFSSLPGADAFFSLLNFAAAVLCVVFMKGVSDRQEVRFEHLKGERQNDLSDTLAHSPTN